MKELEIEINELRDNTVKGCEKYTALLNDYILRNEGNKDEITRQIERATKQSNIINELCDLYLSHSTDIQKIQELNNQL